jgi:uncharacterized membrane protein
MALQVTDSFEIRFKTSRQCTRAKPYEKSSNTYANKLYLPWSAMSLFNLLHKEVVKRFSKVDHAGSRGNESPS